MLSDVPGIGFIELTGKDVVRHRIVAAIVEAYRRYEEKLAADQERDSETMTLLRRNPAILSLLVIAVTIVLVAVALIVGRSTGEEPPVLVVGQPSPQQFIATETISVEDAAATEQARTSAYNAVETIVVLDPGVDIAVANNIRTLFVDGLLATARSSPARFSRERQRPSRPRPPPRRQPRRPPSPRAKSPSRPNPRRPQPPRFRRRPATCRSLG